MPTNTLFDCGVRTVPGGFKGHCYVCQDNTYHLLPTFDDAKKWFREHFRTSHPDYQWIGPRR